MDFRTILAMVLMVIIYFYFLAPTPQAPQTPQQATEKVVTETELVGDQGAQLAPLQKPEPAVNLKTPALALKLFELSNEKMSLQLNGLGEIQSIRLQAFDEDIGSDKKVFWSFESVGFFNQQLLDTTQGVPDWKLVSSTETEILLKSVLPSGSITRRIWLEPNSYILRFSDDVLNQSSKTLIANLSVQLRKPIEKDKLSRSFWNPYSDIQESVWSKESSLQKTAFASLLEKGSKSVSDTLDWAGFSTRYFFLGFIAQNFSISSLEIKTVGSDQINKTLGFSERQIEPKSTANFEYEFYLGPKKVEELAKADHQLDHVIDYTTLLGFITRPISRLLLTVLLFFYSIVSNYGVAIILMTILVKFLLLPLAWKASLGMKKMAKLQPKMVELREKYKKDPQRMQAETMKLWKTEKANPFGSCLPMIIQLPVFFALYPVFFVSVEMRHAHFFGWITDLSAKDPYFILPIVLTLVMYGQQKLTPMPTGMGGNMENEAIKIQKAMFKIMPIMMGAFSILMPAGLTLYILVNVLFSFVQQYFFNKKLERMFPTAEVGPIPVKQSNGG